MSQKLHENMGNPAAAAMRFKRLRRVMLELLYAMRGQTSGGWMAGITLRDMVGDRSDARERCESELQQLSLLRDLVLKGLAEERDARTRKDQPFSLDYLDFRIAAPGVSLIDGSTGPDPDIDDQRILLR